MIESIGFVAVLAVSAIGLRAWERVVIARHSRPMFFGVWLVAGVVAVAAVFLVQNSIILSRSTPNVLIAIVAFVYFPVRFGRMATRA